jgi:hypothetical protein
LANLRGLSRRDREILEDIETRRILDIWQIYKLHFPSLYTAQRRMLKLTKEYKRVSRLRLEDQSFAYYTDARPQQIEHWLGINDFYIWLTKHYLPKRQGTLTYWEYPDNKEKSQVRPDAMYSVQYRDGVKWYFLEYETGSNPCSKVADHNKYFEEGRYRSFWWAKELTGYPATVIMTESNVAAVQKKIDTENTNGLEFIPYFAPKIRKEIGKNDYQHA